MMVPNIGNQSILMPKINSTSLQQVINQLNTNVANKRNFDVVELSKKAQALLQEHNDAKENEKTPMIDYENSEMVHSTKWGPHTKAEYAEMSLSSQRNDLQTYSDQIAYQKSKLTFTTAKISELEHFINGTGAHSDPNMTKETAEAYLHNYTQSIANDYANFTIGRSQFHADEFDALSGGLASAVYENPLHSLDAEALGLSNLSDDPEEIMKALDHASNIIDNMTADLERAFEEATGGRGFQAPAQSWSIFGGNSSLDFFASQMENGYYISNNISIFTGEALEIGISSVSDLEVAEITPII